jgi:DNA (cytosine-5)-methyltransferase 1
MVDVVSGGFPCQDLSVAKQGAKGLEGERSGLWSQMARIIGEVRPRFVFVENSPALTFRGLGRVLGDLAEMGFDAAWGVFSAADVGAPHIRERIWILADARGFAEYRPVRAEDSPELGGHPSVRCEDWKQFAMVAGVPAGCGRWRTLGQPGLVRDNDGVADVLDRLHAVGNGQVPAVVRLAWETLMGSSMRNSGMSSGKGEI